jgi:hypothetical protein
MTDHSTAPTANTPPTPARRRARAGRGRAVWIPVAIAVLLSGACSSDTGSDDDGSDDAATTTTAATTGSDEPPVDEAIEQTIVELPDQIVGARYPVWSADGEALVFSAMPADGDTVELYRVAPDGSDLACLTCELERSGDEPYLKPLTFSDGQRVLLRVGEQSPVTNGTHAVLECTPSVAECADAELVPIEVPATDDPALVQPQREFRIAPDGRTVGFTQVRTDAEGAERFVSIVGTLRRDGDTYVVDDPRALTSLGELKNFTPDGSAALVSAFTTLPDRAADPDVVRIDLATGELSDVTDNGDYDEDLAYAPDMASYAVFSGRGQGLFETVAQLRRPNDIGPGLDCVFGYLFANRRKELLEPWVVRDGAEQAGELGQLLNPGSLDEGWDARTLVTWHPDGTRLLFWEDQGDPFAAPSADGTRFVIVDLVDREPSPAGGDVTSPTPSWAPELAGLVPDALPVAESRDGQVSGTVTVTQSNGERPGSGTIEVVYDGFSDDGEWVIDGTESSTYDGGLVGGCEYRADLTASGEHDGTLVADAVIAPGGIEGTLTSDIDGRELSLP